MDITFKSYAVLIVCLLASCFMCVSCYLVSLEQNTEVKWNFVNAEKTGRLWTHNMSDIWVITAIAEVKKQGDNTGSHNILTVLHNEENNINDDSFTKSCTCKVRILRKYAIAKFVGVMEK